MTTPEPTCKNELDWLAFCYAAGDLTAPESKRFEDRLATDQSAREALARAVELTQTVLAAHRVGWAESTEIAAGTPVVLTAPTHKKTRYERIWIGVGLAAALLFVLDFSGVLNFTLSFPEKSSPRRAQLASAWTDARTQMATAADDGIWPALEALTELESDSPADLAISEISEAPSWLTAALLGKMSPAPVVEALTDGPLEN